MLNSTSALATNRFHDFLTTKLRLSPVRVFLVILSISVIDELLVGFLTGHWESTPHVVGAKDDYPHWIASFIFQPAVWAFFIWLPPATENIFRRIETDAIPETHIDAYRQTQQGFWKLINSPWIVILSFVSGIILSVSALMLTGDYRQVPWTYDAEWHRYTIWYARLLGAGFFFSLDAFYSILAMFNLNRVFNLYGVRLNLYHGDNVAGLKYVGDFAWRLNQLALVSLSFLLSDLLLAVQVGQGGFGQINFILELIAFPTGTLFSFVAPLLACHSAMERAKVAELNLQAAEIESRLQALRLDPAAAKEQVENLTALINLRERLRADIPTLPIDITGIRRFSLSFLASLIPAIISFSFEILKSLRP